jgi:hypothetical protein
VYYIRSSGNGKIYPAFREHVHGGCRPEVLGLGRERFNPP